MSHDRGAGGMSVSPEEFAGLSSTNSGSALDALRIEKRQMLAANRATWWALADLDAQAIAQHGAQVLDELASDEQCSKAHIKQRLALRSVFGEHRATIGSLNFSILRAAANAAKRTGRDPLDVLRVALVVGWHVSNLDALGRTGKEAVEFKGECGECGGDMAMRFRKPGVRTLAGFNVACGYCAAITHGVQAMGQLRVVE